MTDKEQSIQLSTTNEGSEPTLVEGFWADPETVDTETLAKARKLFEVGAESPKTYVGYRYSEISSMYDQSRAKSEERDDSTIELEKLQSAILTIKNPLDGAIRAWGDVINDKYRAAQGLARISPDGLSSFDYENLVMTLGVLSGNGEVMGAMSDAYKNKSKAALEIDEDSADARIMSGRSRLMKSSSLNPSGRRKQVQQQLKPIMDGDFDSLLPVFIPSEDVPAEKHSDPALINEINNLKMLDFTVFPKGENLDGDFRDLSEKIYEESNRSEKTQVDLERIKVLKEMAELFGEENCTLARGKARSGRKFETSDGSSIDEDFIILAMKHPNGSEDALAISPISNVHAAFYTRQEANEGLHWNDLLALPKRDAQDLGVRKLKFVGTAELTPYEAMQEKLFTLATCRPQDFNSGLKYNPESRNYTLRKARTRQQLFNAAMNADTYGE